MDVVQAMRTGNGDWVESGRPFDGPADLAIVFAAPALLRDARIAAEVGRRCRGAAVVGASTAGEIHGARVHDEVVALTLVRFASTKVSLAALPAASAGDSRAEGRRLAAMLPPGADHVFVLFQGHDVNGSELVAGLRDLIPDPTGITGGLAADGARFGETTVIAGADLAPVRGAALGFYGESLRVGTGSMGGWDAFGPARRITRSSGNVLYELDGKPALALYKKYLGAHASALPGSALLFPLAISRGKEDPPVVRTILGCDEATESMTFAGDVPEGSMAQLMHANLDRLVTGAECAAEAAVGGDQAAAQLAILISCVGRRLVLKDYVEDEVLAVRNVFGPGAALTGFYSYGEISPFTPTARCELHNQTMTVTTFAEV